MQKFVISGKGGIQKHTWPRGYKTFFMLNSVEHERARVDKRVFWPQYFRKIEYGLFNWF